ncbi:copper chaperone [Cohaesibacter sp. ES.047]|uniref:heavy-metal-associated domain-containing protein n=1 Tax=Cohaesibacter sp. ES.047 TaxID=1798205 RepID=UPI000BC063DE|nr:heavy-metal-associated domain-containing protein [Cohaesibacter sp. ES.047]SNY92116.1 copper chaperone [Cohaesibacter sp. ES.047]
MIKLNVQEMACGGCVKSIKEAITAVDGSAEVNADLESGTVEVTSSAAPETVRQTIEEAGFPAQLA